MYQPYSQLGAQSEKLRVQNPYRILALSFFVVMAIGTGLLMLPQATSSGESTRLVDAAFTSVSCVAVTGLSTVDPYVHWSMFGKIVMLILIQLGGLGIMTFTTLVGILFGQKIGLRNRLIVQEDLGHNGHRGLLRIVKRVALVTFGIEFVGGCIYAYQLFPYIGESALYYGFFQSVSTFCNAGFVFFDNGLPYKMAGDWLYTLNACIMIILGGFGFMAIFDIVGNWRRGFVAFSLHTKVMIVGTFLLNFGGMIIFLLLEWHNPGTLGPMSVGSKVCASLFQAITPRTAGLATLDYGHVYPDTAFFTIVLMFIGAGPNSTGGGVKVSTIAVLFMASISIFSNRGQVEMFERRIAQIQVFRAFSIVFFSMSLIIIATFIVASIDHFDFLDILFEVTSAFGTVGLSRGITPDLSESSKWILIFMMYVGRIGAITLIGTFAQRRRPTRPISYPEGNVML